MGKFNLLFNLDKTVLNLGSAFLSAVRLPLYLLDRSTLRRNSELRRYKTSSRCYILGLGPSLSTVDFSKLEGDTIAVNRFYKVSFPEGFQPTYYCLLDGAFYRDDGLAELVNAIQTFSSSCFLLNGKHRRNLAISEDCSHLYYADCWGGFFKPGNIIDFTKLLPIMGNVACFAIELALYLGYEEIVLLGCDFNSFASRKSVHAYQEVDDARTISLAFELFCYSFVAHTHDLFSEYARQHGIKIINASRGSLIDSYEYDESMINALNRNEG